MNKNDILADARRIDRELENTKVFEIPKTMVSDLKSTMKFCLDQLTAWEKAPLRVPFATERGREAAFERAKDFPNEFYNFQCFNVRITIWRSAGNGHTYNVATFGYMPKSKYFVYHRGYSGKYMYFNPSDDFENCVRDFYLLVGEYMATELGVRFMYNKRSRQLKFEPFDVDDNEVIIKV